jgi:hypothetical protein
MNIKDDNDRDCLKYQVTGSAIIETQAVCHCRSEPPKRVYTVAL